MQKITQTRNEIGVNHVQISEKNFVRLAETEQTKYLKTSSYCQIFRTPQITLLRSGCSQNF